MLNSHPDSPPQDAALDDGAVPVWSRHPIPNDSGRLFRIGPLRLWVGRRAREWMVSSVSEGEPLAADLSVTHAPEVPDGFEERLSRYIAGVDDAELVLTPMLADRSIVVRPERPLFVLQHETTNLYLSTPIWVAVGVAVADRKTVRTLVELPVTRPSDTWFGPSTRDGALAYASTTGAKLTAPTGPVRAGRAVTRIVLSNQSGETLPVDRLALPARELDLVITEDGRIWTDGVRVVVGPNRTADVTIEPTAPDEAGQTSPIGPARDPRPRFTVVRALSALLG
jgi:hypothetical protein